MRTALFLLLLLAIAAVPGSLVPQRSSDPNGVSQYFRANPDLAPVLDKIQLFDVYSSVWFSAIYLLLFASLIGCVIPRTRHHIDALRARPPRTPARLARLEHHRERRLVAASAPSSAALSAMIEKSVEGAARVLRSSGYRTERYGDSISAERGYARESGNLVFHIALLGILVTVGVGGGFGFAGQRVLVEGQSFVNTLSGYDSFNPGRFFDDASLDPYLLTLDDFDVSYEQENADAFGQPIDYTAGVTVRGRDGSSQEGAVKVNDPLRVDGTDIYLLGNGYAPTVTVRDPDGEVVFTDSIPFLPQDANLTSLGFVKVPDGLAEQLGMVGFFYPTQEAAETGAFFSTYPDLTYPVLTLNVWQGDLGLDAGVPSSVYALDTDGMEQIAGADADADSIEVKPGETQDLPHGLGTITFENDAPDDAGNDFSQSVKRFASLDIHHDPTQGWVLVFAILAVGGLLVSLFIPRRRMWVRVAAEPDGSVLFEYAALARGEDPGLAAALDALAGRHAASATGSRRAT